MYEDQAPKPFYPTVAMRANRSSKTGNLMSFPY